MAEPLNLQAIADEVGKNIVVEIKNAESLADSPDAKALVAIGKAISYSILGGALGIEAAIKDKGY